MAGTYYIRVKSESPRDKSKKQSYKLKTEFKGYVVSESGKITKVKSQNKKKAEVTFEEAKDVNGYQIEYSTDKKFGKNVKSKTFEAGQTKNAGNSKRKVIISKLKSHKKYFFRIRAYAEHNNVKYYSGWSNVKSTKIK
ncbi:fibronectin type III domain-containing protein [Butyrivibrio sp. AE3004]|uniref:fibronectin type III domain-containing protein n=1 Tax=Butyrivibrio sp. AE3004 TaxID=1506994 RepID=UPI000493F29D|nr:fibronectin type III domain-containing protein [Butyrivibrio sp. AE3004]